MKNKLIFLFFTLIAFLSNANKNNDINHSFEKSNPKKEWFSMAKPTPCEGFELAFENVKYDKIGSIIRKLGKSGWEVCLVYIAESSNANIYKKYVGKNK